jgi:hypothetical protein
MPGPDTLSRHPTLTARAIIFATTLAGARCSK